MATIGFIGLGQMGLPLAANLISVGHTVIGYDIRTLQVSRLQSMGGCPAESASEAVRNVNFVISCLPDIHALRGLWMEESDAGKAVGKGTIAIDCSTVGVDEVRTVSSYLDQIGVPLLDAAVLGDARDVKSRMITLAVGGSLAAFASASPIMEDMSDRVVHMGRSGLGQAAALCVQLMTTINLVGVAEAFALAERVGLGAEKLFAVSALSSATSWALAERCPQSGLVPHAPSNNMFQPGLPASRVKQQLEHLMALVEKFGARAPLAARVDDLYREFCGAKDAEQDFSAIIQILRQR